MRKKECKNRSQDSVINSPCPFGLDVAVVSERGWERLGIGPRGIRARRLLWCRCGESISNATRSVGYNCSGNFRYTRNHCRQSISLTRCCRDAPNCGVSGFRICFVSRAALGPLIEIEGRGGRQQPTGRMVTCAASGLEQKKSS